MDQEDGRVAQLGEHLLCKQGVRGSNPLTSTNFFLKFLNLLIRLAAFAGHCEIRQKRYTVNQLHAMRP